MTDLKTRFIKIAKIDADGNDNTNSLSTLTTISIPWSNGTIARYKVIGTSQKSTYFDYVVEYEPTSSIYYPDAASFDYSFLNRFAFLITSPTLNQPQLRQVRIENLDANKQIVYDITLPDNNFTDSQFPVNNFNNAFSYNVSNPGVWGSERNKYVLFDTYPQKDLKIEFSGSLTIPANQGAEFDLYCVFRDPQGNPIPPDQDTLSPNPTDGPFYVGGSFNGFTWNPNTDMLRIYSKQKRSQPTQAITDLPFYVAWTIPKGDAIPGSYLELYVQSQYRKQGTTSATATTTVTFAASTPSSPSNFDTRLRIIQTEPASAVTPLQAVFEPILKYKFKGSNCDVLQNNAIEARPNNQIQDIDYSTSQTIPVNYEALKNYTATKATYPASNFTINSILNPNYGSENTVSNYNIGNGFNTQVSAGSLILIYDGITTSTRSYPGVQGLFDVFDFAIKYIYTADGQLIDSIPSEQNLKDCQYNFISAATLFTDDAAEAVANPVGYISPLSGSWGTGSLAPLVNIFPDIDPSTGTQLTPGNLTTVYSQGGSIYLRCDNAGQFLGGVGAIKDKVNTRGIIYASGIEYTSAANNINEVRIKIKTDNLLD